MKPDIFPRAISQVFLGLGQLGIPSLIPSEYQKYVDYLNPEDHEFSFGRGSIDIKSAADFLDFDIRGVRLGYLIPSQGDLPSSEAKGKLDALIKLKGDNEAGRYTSVEISGSLKGYANILGDISRGSSLFATDNLGLDIRLGGLIKIPSADKLSINLDQVDIDYNNNGTSVNLSLKDDFRFGGKQFRANISQASVALSSAETGSWRADLNIGSLGGFTADFKEGTQSVARISSDPGSNLRLEISSGILSRFGISDSYINSLLSGESISLDGQELTQFTATLGQNGSDLNPVITFLAGSEEGSYAIEDVISDFLGLNSVDIRLLQEISGGGSQGSGGGSGGGGGGGGAAAPSAPPASTPTQTPSSTPSQIPTATPVETPTRSIESPVLGIQPQAIVTTVQFEAPIALGTIQVTRAVVGTNQRDSIIGSNAGEALAGGKGADRLTGGRGADGFVFETPGEFGKRNVDTIVDFDPRDGDKIVIASDVFAGIARIKFQPVSGRRAVKSAGKNKSNFVYDTKSGIIYFDANGTKPGFGDGGEFAQLLGTPKIDKSDFAIV